MRKIDRLAGAALAALASFGVPAVGSAQQPVAENGAAAQMRSKDTERALLHALLERRAEIARLSNGNEGRYAALRFLDSRIVEVKNRIAK